MSKGSACYFASSVMNEIYKIMTIDGKIDHLQIVIADKNYKSEYQRWELKTAKPKLEKAMYVLAKLQPEKFKIMYQKLKIHDKEFFEVADRILKKIKSEYNFN